MQEMLLPEDSFIRVRLLNLPLKKNAKISEGEVRFIKKIFFDIGYGEAFFLPFLSNNRLRMCTLWNAVHGTKPGIKSNHLHSIGIIFNYSL
jgi:hypothetical protein